MPCGANRSQYYNIIMQPRISIIVPCYNGEKYLRETLDCLQKQTIENWECIIVNDGSTDGSLEIMKEYAAKDSRYKYIDKKNEGPSVARNSAITASTGKYILPLDADDLVAPSYAEKAINYLEEHDDCKLVYCRSSFFDGREEEFCMPDYSFTDLPWVLSIFVSAVYRKEDFLKTKGYNPNMRHADEDYDFLLSFLQKNDKVYKIPDVLFFYRQHGITRSKRNSHSILRSHLQMILNHPEIYQNDIDRTAQWLDYGEEIQKDLDSIIDSKAYKLGKFILSPYWKLKSYFK